MKVVFADMEQRNTSTGYQRDIRCTSGNPSVSTCKRTRTMDRHVPVMALLPSTNVKGMSCLIMH